MGFWNAFMKVLINNFFLKSRVLDTILSSHSKSPEDAVQSIHEYLGQMAASIKSGSIPLEKFVIIKGLSKDPSQYPDATKQPHVMVALRLREKEKQVVQAGEVISYVICETENETVLAKKAFSIQEYKREGLKLDLNFYLKSQIHPPLCRLCESLMDSQSPYTDSYRLAEAIGLDASKLPTNSFDRSNFDQPEANFEFGEAKYEQCEPLKYECPHCKDNILSKDSSCKCQNKIHQVNAIDQLVRKSLHRYYSNWSVCTGCQKRTRQIPQMVKGMPKCIECKGFLIPEYPEQALLFQHHYWLKEIQENFPKSLMEHRMKRVLSNNSRNFVSLKTIFGH